MMATVRGLPGRWDILVVLVTCVGLLSGCVMGGRSTPATVTVHDSAANTMPPIYPSTTASFPSAAAQAPAPAPTIPSDGTFRVGTDIQPGTYRSAGSDSCYWARLSGLSGDLHDIIANSGSPGPQVVQIAPSDVAFKTQSCPTWTLATPVAPMIASSPAPAAAPVSPTPAQVLSLPPGAQPCPASLGQAGRFGHSATGTSVTSCPFAEQVRLAYAASGPPSTMARQITAVSPVTGQVYAMTCAANGPLITCNGGEDAIVYVY